MLSSSCPASQSKPAISISQGLKMSMQVSEDLAPQPLLLQAPGKYSIICILDPKLHQANGPNLTITHSNPNMVSTSATMKQRPALSQPQHPSLKARVDISLWILFDKPARLAIHDSRDVTRRARGEPSRRGAVRVRSHFFHDAMSDSRVRFFIPIPRLSRVTKKPTACNKRTPCTQ